MIITAKFVTTRIQDSGSDSVMDYKVYVFDNIVDHSGNKYKSKWIKTTKLLEAVSLVCGKSYTITLSSNFSDEYANMPYPKSIIDGKEEYYKHGGLIKKRSKKGGEETLTQVSKSPEGSEFPAIKLLINQKMTEEYLLRKNNKGIFFKIEYRLTKSSYSKSDKPENYLLVQQRTKADIEKSVKSALASFYTLKNHFAIKTEIIK